MQKIKRFSIVLASIILAACSTVPEDLRVEDDNQLVAYPDAVKNISAAKNKQARWGGEIVAVKNGKDKTMLELIYFKSYSSSKPKPSDDSLGRFRVYVDTFLEPGIYKKGRLVSALGTIGGLESSQVGERNIKLPVLKKAAIYLWPKVENDQWKNRWDDPFWPYSRNWYWQRYHTLHPYYISSPKSHRSNPKRNKSIKQSKDK